GRKENVCSGISLSDSNGQERIAQSADAQVTVHVLGQIKSDAGQVKALLQLPGFVMKMLQQQDLPLKDGTEQAAHQAAEGNQQPGPAVLLQDDCLVESEIAHPSCSIV